MRGAPWAARKWGRAALAAVFAVSVAPCAPGASAQPRDQADDRNPIRIESCSVDQRTLLFDPFNSQRINQVSGITLHFADVRGVAATRVEFSLRYAGSTQRAVASGTFAAGRLIERTEGAFAGTAYTSASEDCRVTSAVFADGSSWSAAP